MSYPGANQEGSGYPAPDSGYQPGTRNEPTAPTQPFAAPVSPVQPGMPGQFGAPDRPLSR
jgi:hypothetical protein